MKRVAGKFSVEGMEFGLQRQLEKSFNDCIKQQLKDFPPDIYLGVNDKNKITAKVVLEAFADSDDFLVWEENLLSIFVRFLTDRAYGMENNLAYLKKDDKVIEELKHLLVKTCMVIEQMQSNDPQAK